MWPGTISQPITRVSHIAFHKIQSILIAPSFDTLAIRANRLSASQIGSLAQTFARYLNTNQQRANFQQFFVDHPDTGISTTNLNKALELIDKNIVWASAYRQPVYDWLRVKNGQSQS